MRWLLDWWRGRRAKCPRAQATTGLGSAEAQAAAAARVSAERALAEANAQGAEVSAVAGRLRRARVDDFAQLMTDAMRGT